MTYRAVETSSRAIEISSCAAETLSCVVEVADCGVDGAQSRAAVSSGARGAAPATGDWRPKVILAASGFAARRGDSGAVFMLSFLVRLAINAAALLFIAGASGGAIQVKDAGAAIIAALVLGVANALIKPILQFVAGALTLPLSCITLGLWNLVLSLLINAGLFYAVGEVLDGFEVRGFWPAVGGALAMSIVNSLASGLFSGERRERG